MHVDSAHAPLARARPRARLRHDGRSLVVATSAARCLFAGQTIELARRPQLFRVLLALANAHVDAPGAWIDCTRLVEVAWRGERMRPSSAMNRLHVAIAELRKLGLRSALQSKRGAYRIKTDVRVAEVLRVGPRREGRED